MSALGGDMKTTYFFGGLLCDQSVFDAQFQRLKLLTNCVNGDITQASDLFAYAKNFLISAPKTFNLVGFSLGSWFTQIIAYLAPERVERFCIISSADCELLPQTIVSMQEAVNKIQQGGFSSYIEASLDFYLTSQDQHNQGLKNKMLAMMRRVGPEVAIRQLSCLLNLHEKPFPDLSFLSCPTYIIRGREDARVSLDANQRMQQQIKNAKLYFVEGSAHFVPLEQPEKLNEILLNWLKE